MSNAKKPVDLFDKIAREHTPEAFRCITCDGCGGLTIAGVTYLELTCPTCHGLSRGMSAEEFFRRLDEDE